MALDQKKVDTMVLNAINFDTQAGGDVIENVTTTEKSKHIDFPHAFDDTPVVVASLAAASYNRRLSVNNITPTGFDAVVALTSGGPASVWFKWIAHKITGGGGTP